MKKIKAKLTALLMALSCVTAGAGVAVVAAEPSQTGSIVAQAETSVTINKIAATGDSSATVIYAYPTEDSKPTVNNWDDKFTFVDSTGTGFCLNGTALSGWTIKQPGDFYIELGTTATAGDVITLDGKFLCSAKNESVVFNNCGLLYNGTTWETVTTVQNVGALTLHANSSVGGASGLNSQLYLWPTSGTPSVLTWAYLFAPQTAASFKINGEPATLAEMKSTGDGIWFSFGALSAGDIVTVGGTYYCKDLTTVYYITESHFLWNGSGWSVYVPPIEYQVCQVGKVVIADGSGAGAVYLNKESGAAFEKTDGTWAEKLAFEAGSGVGVTINGAEIPLDMAIPNNIYLGFSGYSAEEGDILTIGGTFYNENLAVKYVIQKSIFQWDGSAWGEVDYPDCNLGQVYVSGGDSGSVYLKPVDENVNLAVDSWDYEFSYVSGNGITVNGVMIDMNNSVKSPGGTFFANLGKAASVGDILKVGGVFRCEAAKVDYVIEDRQFQWTGSAWTIYGEEIVYDEYNLGKMSLNWPSTGAANAKSGQLYLNQESGEALPIPDSSWTTVFALESGDGLKVNGEVKTLAEIKSTDLGLFLSFAGVNKGDVVSISGTFVCAEKTTRYEIEESKFVWNGTTWERYVAVYEVGGLVFNMTYGEGKTNMAHFDLASGEDFVLMGESGSEYLWNLAFSVENGVGVTVNGQANAGIVKVPDNFFVELSAEPQVGDVLAIGGTFYNETLAVKYVVEESKFEWNGSAWVDYVEEKIFNVGNVAIGNESNASAVYFAKANGDNFDSPTGWTEKFAFVEDSGIGITINGVQISMDDIKVPGTMYVGLGTTAVKGDVLAIGGSFYNEAQNMTYIITESKFEWNGEAWENFVNYTTYNVGDIILTNDSNAGAVYIAKANSEAFEVVESTWTEKLTFVEGSGVGVTINGVQISMGDIKIPGTMYVGLGTTVKAGDKLAVQGTFYNKNLAVKYVIPYAEFVWNGSNWVRSYADSQLAVYDTVTIVNLGLGAEQAISGTYDGSGLSYIASEANTTGSVKFRFGYNSTNTAAGCIDIRLRGEAWAGFQFRILENRVEWVNSISVPLTSNTDYVIELGVINMADGENAWLYISVDGVLMVQTVVAIDESNSAYTTSHVSIYAGSIAATTITDPDHVAVTYTTSNGSFVEYANRNEAYTVISGRTYNAFVGWAADGVLYAAGDVIDEVTTAINFTAVEIDFNLQEGAAIRLANTSDESGIRFTTYLKQADVNKLVGNYGIASVSYGTLIMPYDYLGANQAPNLEDFVAGETVLKIESTYQDVEDGYLIYRGAMQKMYTANYGRLFAGRGYMEITFENGEVMTVYTSFDKDDNVRSIRYVAQAFMADSENFDVLTDEKKAVVEGYAALDEIELMNYASYAENNVFAVTAWYYPELDSSNAYNNATNIAIAQKMKDAGIKAVYLDGEHHLNLDTDKNIEETRQIIEFFWSQGLYTIAFGSNASTNVHIDYSSKAYPDFAECEGFIGYLVWDEPSLENMEQLADFARNFNVTYAGTDTTFMANLLPSYASNFNGTTNWWESSIDSLNKDAYKAYLQSYCDTVLSQIQGEKWLSMDSYPINADESLTANFLFDLAMLKYYSLQAGASSHAVLQSSGWTEDGNTTKNRMPTEAEMRMQAYAAMAFGIDSISWWSYSDKRGDEQENPTDSDEYYTRFANVNNELAAISAVYASFNWKGVILGTGKDNGSKLGSLVLSTDQDYEAYNLVNGQIGAYQLSASDTKHLASVSTNKTDWNYLMGVMQDMNGNEGYVLCNYNSHEEDRAQTVTLTFDSNVTEVIIYRGGVAQTVPVSNKTLAVTLATGEGVIILPSKLA